MSNDERGGMQSIWTCARARREDAPQSDGLAVLDAIDRLRRELTGYHGQLKAWGDLKVHADRQRVRIGELEGLYAKAKAERNELRGENDKLRKLGRETCEVDGTVKWDWDICGPYWQHELSCGHTVMTSEPEPPKYCPECGRKVVGQ